MTSTAHGLAYIDGMRKHATTAAMLATAGCAALTGCSSGTESGQVSAPPSATTSQTSVQAQAPALGAVEVSPGGVTTSVGAPAESTEEEYFQACQAAKVWMEQRGGDPMTLIEPYLATVQVPDATPSPATFNAPWSQLSPARQAAVIVAVEAAADQLCG
jgi:hypothetical protein